MDSQPQIEGRLLDIVSNKWRAEKLPNNQISVPLNKLPDPEADGSDSHLTLSEQEQKWNELGLGTIDPDYSLHDQMNLNTF